MTTVHTLRRQTTIANPDEWERRSAAYTQRVLPYLQEQPGFVSHEIVREGDGAGMVEKTAWSTAEDCRNFVRGGPAATAATWLDAFLPTAPYPNGNWIRETTESST